MNELDKKLEDILRDVGDQAEGYSVFKTYPDDPIKAIKQAFKNAGYSHWSDQPVRKITIKGSDVEYDMNVMTGQEWYDRFLETALTHRNGISLMDMMDAAKKAAGIEQ